MQQFKTDILSNNCIGSSYYEMTFNWDKTLAIPLPGQFLAARVEDTYSPLLRRPFAFSAYNENSASIIFQKRGPATEILSTKKPGNKIDIIAPMGNTFLENFDKNKNYILAAGGIGLGPMLFLGEYLRRQEADVKFIFGCRTEKLIPALKQFVELDALICTDDGSSGLKGTVTDYLEEIEVNLNSELYCCGPEPMLKACHHFSENKNIPCRVSMEQIMACSIGACMGCVIKVKSGFARVCREGPVFDSRDIEWT
jgi:dihydroorotate dehydrogenase electron transfer subunit